MSFTTAFVDAFAAPPGLYPTADYSPAALAGHTDYYHWLRQPLSDLQRIRTELNTPGGPAPDADRVDDVLWGFDSVMVCLSFTLFSCLIS